LSRDAKSGERIAPLPLSCYPINALTTPLPTVFPPSRVAEAVRACGSVDVFLQHLDLVTGITHEGPSA